MKKINEPETLQFQLQNAYKKTIFENFLTIFTLNVFVKHKTH